MANQSLGDCPELPFSWFRPLEMPSTRYSTFKTVTIFKKLAETVFEVCASEKVSVFDIKAVQCIKRGEKCP